LILSVDCLMRDAVIDVARLFDPVPTGPERLKDMALQAETSRQISKDVQRIETGSLDHEPPLCVKWSDYNFPCAEDRDHDEESTELSARAIDFRWKSMFFHVGSPTKAPPRPSLPQFGDFTLGTFNKARRVSPAHNRI
jgi:hypothetical protein